MGNVILHAFNWRFGEIAGKAAEIGGLGYTGVLISPPAFSEGKEWFCRYQPLDYRVIDSPLGGLKDLESMSGALKKNGVKVYVDVVFNHMAARGNNDLNYPGEEILARYREDKRFAENRLYGDLSENLFSAGDFHAPKRIDAADYDDPNAVRNVQNDRIADFRNPAGLPDLNHEIPNVVSAQKGYLSALKGLGVGGFRIDAAKHMPMEHIRKVFSGDVTKGMYVFGEIIPAHHGMFLDEFLKEVDFSAYDFNLFYSVRAALAADGSMEKMAAPDQLDRFRSLTFAVTHDIPNNEAMRMFILDGGDAGRADEKIAYAFLLGRDGGVPLVYSDKGEADGVYSNLWKDAYRDPHLKEMIRFHHRVAGKGMEVLSAGKCHLIFHREGVGVAALNKCSDPVRAETEARNITGSFRDVISGKELRISGERFAFDLPARSVALYLKK